VNDDGMTPEQRKALEAESRIAWMVYRRMRNNKNQPMEWIDRSWQLDILADDARQLAVIKGAQIGLSTIEIFRVIHRCLHHNLTWIYILPTRDDIFEFSPLKFDPIMTFNDFPGKVASKEQKYIGEGNNKSYLVFKGSWKEHEAIMIDADGLSYDEVDKCKPDVLETYESRIQASEFGWEDFFSTPTTPNTGIDKKFQESDQRHWFIWCSHCGEAQFLQWPASVCYDRKAYVCKHCDGILTNNDRRKGQWVKKFPGREIHGFWVSQMMAPWISAKQLIAKEDKKGRQYFYNYCLGIPYVGSEISVSEGVILKNLRDHRNTKQDACMGVDIGKTHHYVIGNREGIFEIGTLDYSRDDERKGWDKIALKIQEFDVRTCVVDGLPDVDEARDLCKQFPFRVWANFYHKREEKVKPVEFKQVEKQVISDRYRTLETTIGSLYAGEIGVFLNPNRPSFTEYVEQWKSVFLKTETDKQGVERKVWASITGNDHFPHATNYWRIARDKNKASEKKTPPYDPDKPDSQKMLEKRLASVGAGGTDDGDWYTD